MSYHFSAKLLLCGSRVGFDRDTLEVDVTILLHSLSIFSQSLCPLLHALLEGLDVFWIAQVHWFLIFPNLSDLRTSRTITDDELVSMLQIVQTVSK